MSESTAPTPLAGPPLVGPALAATSPKAVGQRFLPLAACVGILAGVSIGLIAWAHLGWNRLQARAHDVDRLLHEVRQEARQSQLLVEQRVVGNAEPDAEGSTDGRGAKVQAAVSALQGLGQSGLDTPLGLLQTRVARAAQALDQRWHDPDQVSALDVQHLLNDVDDAARQTESAWQTELQRATAAQHRLDKINMGLVAGLSLLLLWLLNRSHRQREAAMHKLQQRDAQLRAFAEVLPDVAFRMTADGKCQDIHGSNLALLGRPPAAMIGMGLADFFPPDMAARFEGALKQALEHGTTQSLTFSVNINKEVHHFDSRCAPLGDSGEVVWMIWDVTSRRQTEHRLRRKNRMYDFLSHVNQAIVRSEDEQALLTRVCQVAVDHGQFRKAWVAQFELPGVRRLICRAEAGDVLEKAVSLNFDLLPREMPDAQLDSALRNGRTYRTRDLSRDRMPPAWVQLAVSLGLPGCAWATVVVNYSMLALAILLVRGADLYRPYRIWKRPEPPDWKALGAFVRLGIPTALSITVVFVPQYFRVIRAEVVRLKGNGPPAPGARLLLDL